MPANYKLPKGTKKIGQYLIEPNGKEHKLPDDAMRPDINEGELPAGAQLDAKGHLVFK